MAEHSPEPRMALTSRSVSVKSRRRCRIQFARGEASQARRTSLPSVWPAAKRVSTVVSLSVSTTPSTKTRALTESDSDRLESLTQTTRTPDQRAAEMGVRLFVHLFLLAA